ncbi:MAG: helix-turn-helix domain-containing protein [Anaerolineae bacterium]|nr:helix-turn-helix domain-containing protein [Anaerolineae bacterium]
MDFKDISSRLKANREQTSTSEPREMDYEESYRIRGKMIGVLLRDARTNAGRSIEDCARVVRVEPEQIEAWEYGDRVPSLPQLEILAYYLDVPVSHFWSMETLGGDQHSSPRDAQREYMALRDRMIGVLLRQAREDQNLTLEAVSETSHIPVDVLTSYELGELSLPMHELSVLAGLVRKNTNYFLESSGHIGHLLAVREEWSHFTDLPEEIRQFAADPLNLGFIEIAIMFKQMPTDKLRRIAESMLEITM